MLTSSENLQPTIPQLKKLATHDVPVVVTKCHHGGLGIARSLGRLNVPVYGIHPNMDDPTLVTRYFKEISHWDLESGEEAKSIEFLLNLGKKLGSAILIATSDTLVDLLSRNVEALSEYYIFPHLEPSLIHTLSDKYEMYKIAKQHGIPTPEAWRYESRDELLDISEIISYPVMFKGIDGGKLKHIGKPKMMKVNSAGELLNAFDEWEDPLDIGYMIQEFIPGGEDSVWMFNGYFDENSECLFGISGKKVRQYPAYKGATSMGICLTNRSIFETTLRFMKAIGYRGILDIGYRYDERDGKYKVLDINPRIGSSFRLFVGDNGLDVIRTLYMAMTQQPVPKSNCIEGRKWWVENQDISSFFTYRSDGKLNIFNYLSSFSGVKESTWFAFDDPKPFVSMLSGYFKKRVFG